MKHRKIFTNQLSLVRRRRLLQQKQVATLLGHKKAETLSRYERGTKMPSLKTALKLAIIYKIPIRAMLDGYYEACRAEILRHENELGKTKTRSAARVTRSQGYCSFEERLKTKQINGLDLKRAHKHTIELVRLRGERLNHRSTTQLSER